jgi:hypothetical protein
MRIMRRLLPLLAPLVVHEAAFRHSAVVLASRQQDSGQ